MPGPPGGIPPPPRMACSWPASNSVWPGIGAGGAGGGPMAAASIGLGMGMASFLPCFGCLRCFIEGCFQVGEANGLEARDAHLAIAEGEALRQFIGVVVEV